VGDLGLGGSTFGSATFGQDEGVDPMANITNMVDAMLVLAVGLMMALVTLMNVNLLDLKEIMEDDLSEVEDAEQIVDDIQMTENPYVEMGTMYVDTATGKQYLLQQSSSDDDADSSSTSGTSGSDE
jgi:hypothetical protein